METVWQDATISECAKICLQSFNDCLTQFHLLSPRQQSAVDDQLGRFSIWVSNIGVFAPTRGSLDYRLREAPDIQRLVRRLLRTLNDYIQQYLSQLDYIHPFSESTSESPEPTSDSLDSIVSGIAEEVTLMHQLSNTIRKASKESQNVRAVTSFKILDDDGNDIGQWFLDLFALGIIQRRFPSCNEALQKRLAAAMLIRRKRILYRQSRSWTSPSKIPSAPEKVIPRPSKDVTNQEQAPAPQKPEPAPTKRELSVAGSRAVTATTLNLEHWKKASAPSVISRAKTIHWSSHEQLHFPPPPLGPIRRRLKALRERHVAEYEERLKLLSTPQCQLNENKECAFNHDPHIIPFNGSGPVSSKKPDSISLLQEDLERKIENDRIGCSNGSMEVICPYCCCSISSSIVTNKLKWIDHVKYDLDPYVCLFEDCDSPTELYNHSEDWLNHMRQHSLRWRCTAKSHGVLVFHNRGEYEEHMSSKHRSTKSQLKILGERSSRPSDPLFHSCPLCGESTGNRLEEHVASHLRYLALKSIPFPDDHGYDDCSEELASEFQSSGGRSRSTILEDNDPAESDHSLLPDQLSEASEQPHSPTSRSSSGWEFIGYANTTDYDPSSDPILATFQTEMISHDIEPKPLSSNDLDGSILDVHRRDGGPVDSTAAFYPDSEDSVDELESDMLPYESEGPAKCPILTCDYNAQGFTRIYDQRRHLLTHFKGTMVCGFCPESVYDAMKSFNSADVFRRHLISEHGAFHELPDPSRRPDRVVSCSNCSNSFVTVQEFYKHFEDCVIRTILQDDQKATMFTHQSRGQDRPEVDNQQQWVRSQHRQIAQAKIPKSPTDLGQRYNHVYQQHLLRSRQDMAARLMQQYGPPTQYPPGVAREYTTGLEQAAKDFVLDMMRREIMELASAPSETESMLREDIYDMMKAERSPPPDFGSSNAPILDEQLLSSPLGALGKTDVGYEDAAESPVPRRVRFEKGSHSDSDNDPYKMLTAPTRRPERRVLCHACGRVWTSGQPLRLDCPHCYSDFTEIIMDPQGAEPSDPADVGNFNTLTDLAQSMSIETDGVNFESAPGAPDVNNSSETTATTDGDLFARAVSKYRDAFLEQHSYLAENERLQLWTQQLSQFIDGTSSPYGHVDSGRIYNHKSSSGKSRRPTSPDTVRPRSGSERPAERFAVEDTLKFQSAPVNYPTNADRTGPTGTLSGMGRETYVTGLNAKTVDHANSLATPGRAHRDEVLKRPRPDVDAVKHADTVSKSRRTQRNEFSKRTLFDKILTPSAPLEGLAAHGENAQSEWASSGRRGNAAPSESPWLGDTGERPHDTNEDGFNISDDSTLIPCNQVQVGRLVPLSLHEGSSPLSDVPMEEFSGSP
ncbi:hypothetical protein BDW68DRAFT_159782 [Aspergillus falconensis]